jgi:hypothetical protein
MHKAVCIRVHKHVYRANVALAWVSLWTRNTQEVAKAFLCALEMVAAALQYISRSEPLREGNMTVGLTL